LIDNLKHKQWGGVQPGYKIFTLAHWLR